VPHVVLVDTEGKIVFKGHPASRQDLEKDFDVLLKGEKLEEVKEEKNENEGEAKAEKQSVDPDEANSEIDAIKPVLEGLLNDAAIKERAAKMGRNFCVLVCASEYDLETGTAEVNYTNYRDLEGDEEDVSFFKTLFEEKVKGKFEVKLC